MAARDCIPEKVGSGVFPACLRRLKISYASRYPDYRRIPAINLKGQWLDAAGFTTGTEVDVRVMNGCIILTAKQPEPELINTLRQVTKLSACKQRQVQELISVVGGKILQVRLVTIPAMAGIACGL